MNVMFWNCRGIGNPNTRRTLYNNCLGLSLDFLCLAEPKVPFNSIPSSYWRSLGLVRIFGNLDSVSSLWVLASDTIASQFSIIQDDQCVSVDFSFDNVMHRITFVYAKTLAYSRRTLWTDLRQLNFSSPDLWFVIGDFNAVFGAHEKMGGRPPNIQSCSEFITACDDCDLSCINTRGNLFTWSNMRIGDNHIELHLDRALCTQSCYDFWKNISCFTLPRHNSDHNPLMLKCFNSARSGPKPFRFHSMWISHPSFSDFVKNSWSAYPSNSHPMINIQLKLKLLRRDLRKWNVEIFGNLDKNIDKAKEKLNAVQGDISTHGFSESLHQQEIDAHSVLESLLAQQETLAKEKSRIKWLASGDRNTSFYHAISSRKSSLAGINSLDINGTISNDPSTIEQHVIDYFSSLFAANNVSHPVELSTTILDSIPSLVSNGDNEMLTGIPTDEEIKAIVFNMDASSAPGPDGFTGAFFKDCWSIVSYDVCKAVVHFFLSGNITPGFNSSFMILIPKIENALTIDKFRPIILSNFLFKIVTKMLASRLGSIASCIVSSNQFGFVKGRSIDDCISCASECVNLLDLNPKGNMAIKVDIRKAFDSMSWSYIIKVFEAFGFSNKFCSWLLSIFNSARISILFPGGVKGYFSCSRGVRQDDVLIFGQATRKNLKAIQSLFNFYGDISGQIVNWDKSEIYFGKHVTFRRATGCCHLLGIKQGSLPFCYLGVPLFRGAPKRCYFQALADKILSRFGKWKGKLLSMAGRVTLVNSVIRGSFIHSFSIYKWPKSLISLLSRAIKNFVWTGCISVRKNITVSWNTCCLPFDNGGLNLPNLTLLNEALLHKLAWNICSSDSFVFNFLRHRFTNSWGDAIRYPRISSIWSSVKNSFAKVYNSSQWLVEKGSLINFWNSNWLGQSIANRLHLPYAVRKKLHARICDVFRNGDWQIPHIFKNMYPEIINDLNSYTFACKDELIWTNARDGVLSCKSSLLYLRGSLPSLRWNKEIWKPFIPPSRSMLCWRLFHMRIPTDDMLRKAGITLVSVCRFCYACDESITHIFIQCPFAVQIWNAVESLFMVKLDRSSSPLHLFTSSRRHSFGSQVSALFSAAIISSFWTIWKFRNDCTYENITPNISFCLRLIWKAIKEVDIFRVGYSRNSQSELHVLKLLNIKRYIPKAPCIIEVSWKPPPSNWMKVNTDGAALGAPGLAGAGGIFRNYRGFVQRCFAIPLGICFAYEAEMVAVIYAIQEAWRVGWNNIWIECDSLVIVNAIKGGNLAVPWKWKLAWQTCLFYLSKMNWVVTHIFREGNEAADILSKKAVHIGTSLWWSSSPDFLANVIAYNSLGQPNFRFCN
ncbi:uncharacterized protein LOC130015619 [Mercurialis annua]|uniref:uncharacterized protein LOC130015619 n=1 Tax=Mercurialis annua TaxID=3986 RepID=UPI0024AF145F|nr:uncharacterized protein LOC130015619 [Mercurialis annua]